ncbi:MAG: HAD family acid phosphatase [Anaerovoracaceae bacterium]
MKKSFVKIIIPLIVMTLVTGGVFAASGSKVNVDIYGKDLKEGAAFIEDGVTYIALRDAFESMGSTVKWDNETQTVTVEDPARISNYYDRETYVNGAIWQLSAEARACFYQAFSLAYIRLDEEIAKANTYSKPIAIIADIDDTLVDGVMYTADVLQGGPWVNDAFAESLKSTACMALPGAVDFMNYAKDNGVEVFYITNRSADQFDITLKQLEYLGFPNAKKEYLQVLEGTSNKDARRANVEATHEVVMLLGDNLGDFSSAFERKLGPVERRNLVDDERFVDLWGDKWIILPNAVYGDFTGAVTYHQSGLTDVEKAQYIRELFDYYKYTNTDRYKPYQ